MVSTEFPDRTEKFVDGSEHGHGRMYATGDLVKVLRSGDLEFVGRVEVIRSITWHNTVKLFIV